MLFLQWERAQEACPVRTQCFPWEVSLDRLRAAQQGPQGLARDGWACLPSLSLGTGSGIRRSHIPSESGS